MAERFVPIWRDPAYLRRRRKRRLPQGTVFALSGAVAALLAVPGQADYGGFDSPISFELRDHNPVAWGLVVFLVLVLMLHGRTLSLNQRKVSAVVMWTVVAALGVISATDPHSVLHLTVFVAASVLATVWLFLVSLDLEDRTLWWLAAGSAFGIFVCQAFVGIGERILVACLLVGLNLVHYGHLEHD